MIEYKLSDYLNSINWTKVNLLDGDDLTWEKKYPPYVITVSYTHLTLPTR